MGFRCVTRGCLVLLVLLGHGWANEPDPLLLISLDGCRHDYLTQADTPNLDRLAARGIGAAGLIPPFPSKTFPSHYTLVTGLYPAHHGIIDNVIHDPAEGATFRLSDRIEIHRSRWWKGEPVWITAERAGMKTAPLHWPGSEAKIAGLRPSYWEPYDHHMPHETKISRILDFLDMPEHERPAFLTLYYPDIDAAGHRHGPNSREVQQALERVDRSLGNLLAGLKSRQRLERMHVLVVSDHGMTSVDAERVIILDEYTDLTGVTFLRTGVLGGIQGPQKRLNEIEADLRNAHPNLAVFRRDETPDHLHYRGNVLIPPLVLLPDFGWQVLRERRRAGRIPGKGAHGYDGRNADMHGIFIAAGPTIPIGETLPAVRAIDVYNLMCRLLNLSAAPNDGGSFLVDAIGLN